MRFGTLVLALLLLAGCEQESAPNVQQAPAVAETKTERDEAVREAFKEGSADRRADSATTAAIADVLQRLGKAGTDCDATAGLKLFDLESMCDLVLANAGMANANVKQREAFVSGMRTSAQSGWFSRASATFMWARVKLPRVDVSGDGRFAVAYARLEQAEEGVLTKFRFWLVNGEQGWRVYDWENLNMSIRMSRMAGSLMASQTGFIAPEWTRHTDKLNYTRYLIELGDYAGARANLRQLDRVIFPSEINSVLQYYNGMLEVYEQQYAKGLEYLDAALRNKPEFADARYGRGLSLAGLARHEEAIVEFKWYLDTLGSDPLALGDYATSLTHLDRHEEAKDLYRASHRDTPSAFAVVGVAICEPGEDFSELKPMFEALPNPATDYPEIAKALWDVHFLPAALKVVNEAFRATHPDDRNLHLWSGKVAYHEGDFAEAARQLRPILPKSLSEDDEIMPLYRSAMLYSGQAVQALRDEAGSKAAFTELADELYFNLNDMRALWELCLAWYPGREKEPLLHMYMAYVDEALGRYGPAEIRIARAYKLAQKDEKLASSIREDWFGLLYAQGRTIEAYLKLPGRPKSFKAATDRSTRDGNAFMLECLLTFHAKRYPGDAGVPLAKGNLAFLRGEWATAATELNNYLGTAMRDKAKDWLTLERCVRAAVRSNKQALVEPRCRRKGEHPDHWLLVLLYVSSNQPKKALDQLDAYRAWLADDEAYAAAIQDLYTDADVGETIRRMDYNSLHRAHPPAKGE